MDTFIVLFIFSLRLLYIKLALTCVPGDSTTDSKTTREMDKKMSANGLNGVVLCKENLRVGFA